VITHRLSYPLVHDSGAGQFDWVAKSVVEPIVDERPDSDDQSDPLRLRVPRKWTEKQFIMALAGSHFDRVQSAQALWHAKPAGPLGHAVRLFGKAVELEDVELRIITLMTSLETLLSEGSGELTEKLAVRFAWLTEPGVPNVGEARPILTQLRMNRYHKLRELYQTRSRLVHGDVIDAAKLPEKLEELRECVTSAICRMIAHDELFAAFSSTEKKQQKALLNRMSLGAL
jgi:hypothetical protein